MPSGLMFVRLIALVSLSMRCAAAALACLLLTGTAHAAVLSPLDTTVTSKPEALSRADDATRPTAYNRLWAPPDRAQARRLRAPARAQAQPSTHGPCTADDNLGSRRLSHGGTLWSWPGQNPFRWRDPSGRIGFDGASTDRAIGAGQNWADPAFMRGLNQGAAAGAVFNALGAAALFGGAGLFTGAAIEQGVSLGLARLASSPMGVLRWLGLLGTASSQVVKGCASDGIAPGPGASPARDHIAIGFERIVERQAASVGARHLMNDASWKSTFMNAMASGSKFTVFLDDMKGTSVYEKVMTSLTRNASGVGGATDFELSQLYQAGKLGTVDFIDGGVPQSNPFR